MHAYTRETGLACAPVAAIGGIGPVAWTRAQQMGVHRIGLVAGDDPGSAAANTGNPAAELARLDLELRAKSLPELKAALAHIAADEMEGLLNFQGGLSFVNRQLIIDSRLSAACRRSRSTPRFSP